VVNSAENDFGGKGRGANGVDTHAACTCGKKEPHSAVTANHPSSGNETIFVREFIDSMDL
jgi:hypothetical protein